MPLVPSRRATAADLAALPEDVSAEVVGGVLLPLPLPSFEHADALGTLSEALAPYRTRSPGFPGGWWMASSVDLELEAHEVHCPDLVGWRWERHQARPRGSPVRARPDWVCEVISPATARRDRVEKLRTLQRTGVQHYWILDPSERTLSIHRWHPEGYLLVTSAAQDETVRAEPFDGLRLRLAELWSGGQEPVSATQP